MSRILIIDDEPQMARALNINLKARHYDVATAPDGATALQLASRNPPDAVVLDLGLPDMPGIDVIHGLRVWTPCRSSWSPAEPTSPPRSRPSTPEPTTTSPSPS